MIGMTDHFYSVQILGIVFSVALLAIVFFCVKAKRIQEKYSLVWFFIGFIVLVFSIFRDLMEWFSHIIGIDYAPSAFFSILIAFSYALLLNMSISISTLKKKNKNLIQEVGLLSLRVEEMEKKLEGDKVSLSDGSSGK